MSENQKKEFAKKKFVAKYTDSGGWEGKVYDYEGEGLSARDLNLAIRAIRVAHATYVRSTVQSRQKSRKGT